jgi:RNA polymerase sigma-70 factor (ECF subfamily)
MELVVAGDEDAFAQLVARYEQALFHYLRHMTQDEALTADLMQETWLHVWHHARRYNATRPFLPWVYRIAHHCCIDALRGRQHSTPPTTHTTRQAPAPASQRDEPQEVLLYQETVAAVQAAIQTLPAPHRAVLILRYYHGLSYQEISDIVSCSLGTVKSRLHYAGSRTRRLRIFFRDFSQAACVV